MDGYYGEIRAFGWNWAPRGWLACNGSLVPVSQNQVLYAVIGNQFGGTSGVNFNLPDLRGQSPMGTGTGPGLSPRPNASKGGTEAVTLVVSQLPNHDHVFDYGGPTVPTSEVAAPAADGTSFDSRLWDGSSNPPVPINAYALAATSPVSTTFAPQAIGATGGSKPHENRQPYLAINFCICNDGVYPSPD